MSSDPSRPCEQCGNPVGETRQRGKGYQKRFCNFRCRNIHNAPRRIRIKGKYCLSCGNYGYRKTDYCQACTNNQWSSEDIEYIRQHYPDKGANWVAERLQADLIKVRDKANKLGITLTKEATRRLVHNAARNYMTNHNPMWNEDSKKKVQQWKQKHPEIVNANLEKLFQGHQQIERDKPSRLERNIQAMLAQLGILFESSYFIKPKFIVDIRIDSLIIQADGDYWHGHPRFVPLTMRQEAQQQRDRAQDAYLNSRGFTVIRIWESDLTLEKLISILDEHGIPIPNRPRGDPPTPG